MKTLVLCYCLGMLFPNVSFRNDVSKKICTYVQI